MRVLNVNAVGVSLLALASAFIDPAAARAQSVTTTLPLTFSGEVRQRSDWDDPATASADLATWLRTRFSVRAAPSATLAFYAQVQDSRVFGAESNTTPTAPDQFDLHQAYAQLNGARNAHALMLRAGRQEIAFGNERLVGASNWTNTGRSFDALLFSVTPAAGAPGTVTSGPSSLSLFAATVDERGRRLGAAGMAGDRNDHEALGAFGSRGITPRASVDATVLYDIGGQYRTFDHANRGTADVHLRAAGSAPLRLELEGAYQFGSQRFVPPTGAPAPQNVHAWLLGARIGTAQRPTARVNATLGVDALSGDASPAGATYTAFNTLYATNHPFYGLLDLFTDPAARTNERGLVDAFAQTNWRMSQHSGLHAELHRFAPQALGSTAPAGPLGWEADLNVPYTVSPEVTLETGYSLFRAGAGAAGLSLGATGQSHHWVYLQLRAGF